MFHCCRWCGIRGAKMRFAVVVFPGTWSDHDTHYALSAVLGQEADLVWHREGDLSRYDVVVLPGGFSYGDYLRTGAIARFSPVMEAVAAHAEAGKPVIGICNGFQILCEAHLLPGALMRNDSLQYRCLWVHLRFENAETPFTVACRPARGRGYRSRPARGATSLTRRRWRRWSRPGGWCSATATRTERRRRRRTPTGA